MKKYIFISTVALLSTTLSFAQAKKTTNKPNTTKATPKKIEEKKEKKDENFDLGNEIKKVFDTKVDADIDTTLFDKSMGNMYVNEEKHAMIMIMVIPQDYEKAKAISERDKEKFKGYEMGEIDTLNKKIGYVKGLMKEESVEMYMEMYTVKATEESCIMITGAYKLEDKTMFEKAIMKAVCTAQLAKNK